MFIHCGIDLCSSKPLNYTMRNSSISNLTNTTINNTLIPLISTTSEFQTSFRYYTTRNYLFSNDTTIITVTLLFKFVNNSINNIDDTRRMMMRLTQIFQSLIDDTLINNEYMDYEEFVYLQCISDVNNSNITNNNIYLQWIIVLSVDEDDEIIDIVSEYLLSIKFIKQFNNNLNDENIELIKIYQLDIDDPLHELYNNLTTTNMEIINNTTIIHKNDQYILPQHLREFLLIYIILFAIITITFLCIICWFCTIKCCIVGMDDDDNNNKNVKRVQSFNDLYLNTGPITKWDEIDKNDAEYMMKAFDDDEAVNQNWYKEESDNDNNDDIEMVHISSISQRHKIIVENSYDDTITLKQKLKIQTAFDED